MGDPLVALNSRLTEQLRNKAKEETLRFFTRRDGALSVRCSDLRNWLMEMKKTESSLTSQQSRDT